MSKHLIGCDFDLCKGQSGSKLDLEIVLKSGPFWAVFGRNTFRKELEITAILLWNLRKAFDIVSTLGIGLCKRTLRRGMALIIKFQNFSKNGKFSMSLTFGSCGFRI